jgi:hypothetical protein
MQALHDECLRGAKYLSRLLEALVPPCCMQIH